MSEIHPFLFLVIGEFAVFMTVLAGVSLWSAIPAKPVRVSRVVTPAKSPSGLGATVAPQA
jgi:hypothetical protein